jgi:hypothetical protein
MHIASTSNGRTKKTPRIHAQHTHAKTNLHKAIHVYTYMQREIQMRVLKYIHAKRDSNASIETWKDIFKPEKRGGRA